MAPKKGPIRKGTLKPVPGDGNCLFYSIILCIQIYSLALKAPARTWQALKSLLVGWLKLHAHDTYGQSGQTFEEWMKLEWDGNAEWHGGQEAPVDMCAYAKHMRPSKMYGGALEISAFVQSQKINVAVWRSVLKKPPPHRPSNFELTSTYIADTSTKW